jgi:hypothetical protein
MALLFSPEGQRQRLIAEIAEHFHKPQQEVEPVFNEEYEKLDRNARVKSFVALLASRTVKERLTQH